MEAVYFPQNAESLFRPLRRAYTFHGEDEEEKDSALLTLRKYALEPGFEDFDFETLDADQASAETIMAAAGLAPLGSPARLVVLRRAETLRRKEKQADAEALAAGIAKIGAASCLVLRVGSSPDEDRSKSKTVLTAKLDAAIRAAGALVQFRAPSEDRLADILRAQAKQAGKQLHENALSHLMRNGRDDRTILENELEKAICYAGDAKVVTGEMVEAVGSFDPEDVMFKLVDAITRRDSDLAFRLLRELQLYDNKPQSVAGRLLALLSRQFRLLWQANELRRMRVEPAMLKSLPESISSELPSESGIVSMAWKGRELFTLARDWDRAALRDAFHQLIECDLANKGGGSGSEDASVNVEMLIFRLCRK